MPSDPNRALLGYFRVVEAFGKEDTYGGKANYCAARLYLETGWTEKAEEEFRTTIRDYGNVLPDAALAEIQATVLKARRLLKKSPSAEERDRILGSTIRAIEGYGMEMADRG